jgi:hypothetical protein
MWRFWTLVAALLTLGPHAVIADGFRPWDVAGLWPRDAALGHASTALSGSASSVYFNPALLADAKTNVIEYSHAPWALEPSGYGLAYAQSLGAVGAVGLAWSSYRAAAGLASDQALLSFSHAFEAFGIGAGLRSKEKRSAAGGSGLLASADLGLRQAYGDARWGLSVVGLALNNLSVADPPVYSIGTAHQKSAL